MVKDPPPIDVNIPFVLPLYAENDSNAIVGIRAIEYWSVLGSNQVSLTLIIHKENATMETNTTLALDLPE